MSLVHNERTKLTATWLNSIAAAAVAVGGISPTIAAASGVMSFTAWCGTCVPTPVHATPWIATETERSKSWRS